MKLLSRLEVFDHISQERFRQDKIWGPQNEHNLDKWVTILVEEVGELANAILEDDVAHAYTEAIQVAAVAASIAEHIDEGTHER